MCLKRLYFYFVALAEVRLVVEDELAGVLLRVDVKVGHVNAGVAI